MAERLETILRPPNLLFGRAVCAQNPRSSKKLRAVARLFAGHLILIGRYKALALCALVRHHKARSEDQIVAILFFPTPPFGREGSRTTGRGGSRILPDLLVNQEHVPSQAYHLDGRPRRKCEHLLRIRRPQLSAPMIPPVAAPAAAPTAVAASHPAATTGPSPGIASSPRPARRPAVPPMPAPIPAPFPALSARSSTPSRSRSLLPLLYHSSELFATMLISDCGIPAATSCETARSASAYRS